MEGTLRCRAAENGYHIVSCNNAGPIPMMVSAIYNPDGLVLAKANYAMNELIVANIDVSILKGFIHYNENVYELINITKR